MDSCVVGVLSGGGGQSPSCRERLWVGGIDDEDGGVYGPSQVVARVFLGSVVYYLCRSALCSVLGPTWFNIRCVGRCKRPEGKQMDQIRLNSRFVALKVW